MVFIQNALSKQILRFANVLCKIMQGRIQRFWKVVALYIGPHGSRTKKILGFRWSEKAKITLETISFWQNISINIFKFSSFLYTLKVCQWNIINFSKFANALIRKEKKHLRSGQWEKKNWGNWTLFYNIIINHFFLFHKLIRSPSFAFWYQNDRRNIKRGSRERKTARNGKLQYLFQK